MCFVINPKCHEHTISTLKLRVNYTTSLKIAFVLTTRTFEFTYSELKILFAKVSFMSKTCAKFMDNFAV